MWYINTLIQCRASKTAESLGQSINREVVGLPITIPTKHLNICTVS